MTVQGASGHRFKRLYAAILSCGFAFVLVSCTGGHPESKSLDLTGIRSLLVDGGAACPDSPTQYASDSEEWELGTPPNLILNCEFEGVNVYTAIWNTRGALDAYAIAVHQYLCKLGANALGLVTGDRWAASVRDQAGPGIELTPDERAKLAAVGNILGVNPTVRKCDHGLRAAYGNETGTQ